LIGKSEFDAFQCKCHSRLSILIPEAFSKETDIRIRLFESLHYDGFVGEGGDSDPRFGVVEAGEEVVGEEVDEALEGRFADSTGGVEDQLQVEAAATATLTLARARDVWDFWSIGRCHRRKGRYPV